MNSKLSRIAAPLLIATVMILIVPAMVARTAPDDQRQPSVSSLKAESNFDTPNHVPLSIKGGSSMQSTQAFTLTGWLTIIWGDGKPGSQQALEIYYLANDQNQTIRLLIDAETLQSAGGALALNGRRVTVVGTPHSPAAPGLASAAFQVQSIQLEQSSTAPLGNQANAAVIGSQPWISILCKFSDVTNEPKSLSYFQDMYRGSWPGLDHYWREQSYNLVNVLGSGAVGWYSLPQPRSYYVYDVNGDGQPDADLGRLFHDCTAVADTAVYFPNYVGINLMFNDMLGCCAWGGAFYTTLDGVTMAWRTTWEPPWGYSNITIMGHEMGHGLGLPHSSGHYGQTYDNQWDVMSDSWSNCSRLTDPVYGCIGQHTIAYHKDLLGWIAAGQRYEVAPGEHVTITLEQLALPQSGNYLYIQVAIQGSSTWFYSIEARRNISQSNPTAGYDYKLPGSAIIIHEVETSRDRPANVIDIDGNGNTGDAGAMWLPGETFVDSVNGITITIKSTTPTGFVVSVDNQSLPIADLSVTKYDSPDPVKMGSSLTYVIVVRNNGPSLAADIKLTDTLPVGVAFGSVLPERGNCAGSSIITCSLGTLSSGSTTTVMVNVTPTIGGNIVNTASVSGDEFDPSPVNNTDMESTSVLAVNLSVTKSDSPDPVYAGNTLTYVLTVNNGGLSAATGVKLTDTLPAGIVFKSVTGPCTHASGIVTCSLGILSSGSSAQMTVVVTPLAVGTITNAVTVMGNEPDINLANNTFTQTTTVKSAADLSVSQSDSPDPVKVGNRLTITVTVANNGPSLATGVRLTDTLPSGVTFGAAWPSQGNCGGISILICDFGALVGSVNATVTIVVTPTVGGTITNTAIVAGDEADLKPINNTAVETTAVRFYIYLPVILR